MKEETVEKAGGGIMKKIRKTFGICKNESDHEWNGCVCSICGARRHEWEEIDTEIITEPDSCKWSSNDACTGPDCGNWCDSYYPGREGKKRTTWKCKRCGETKTEEGSVY